MNRHHYTAPLILAVLVLAALVGCGTTTTTGRPAPAEPVATRTAPPATTPPPAPATTVPSKYTPAEWAFITAYPTLNPDAAIKGGYAICESLEIGLSQAQVIESVQGMAQIDRESAKKVVWAATTHLCPR